MKGLDQDPEFTAVCTARAADEVIPVPALESVHPSPRWSLAQLAAFSAPSAPGRSGKWPGFSRDSKSLSFLHGGLWEWT
ncbi:hypothetical protein CapIbe_021131 [Capra ibex]